MNKLKICDTHNDFLTELSPCDFANYINNCKQSGVEILCASYWSSRRNEKLIEDELIERTKILRSLSSNYLLHIEDLWWVKNTKKLDFLLSIKPFSCSLTWNNTNTLAGGTNEKGNLRRWGKECLEKLNSEGILIDLAHLNFESFKSVSQTLKENLYCSHTGFYGLKRHRRNLTDKQIDKIVDSNGFIGLFFFDKCIKVSSVKETFTISDIASNLNYFTSRWGFDNIGIGSDFYGIDNYPINLKDYKDFSKLFDALLSRGYT